MTEQWQRKRARRNMVGHSKHSLLTTEVSLPHDFIGFYFMWLNLMSGVEKIRSDILWGKLQRHMRSVWRQVKGRELGYLTQQTDHKRYRNRMFFAKTFNFRKHLLTYRVGWKERAHTVLQLEWLLRRKYEPRTKSKTVWTVTDMLHHTKSSLNKRSVSCNYWHRCFFSENLSPGEPNHK